LKRTVLFTGAGASKLLGCPITREFLPLVRKELRTGDLFEDFRDGDGRKENKLRKQLHRDLRGLLPGFDEADDAALPLITDVLSLVDYSLLSASTPVAGRSLSELRELRQLLEMALFDLLVDLEPAGKPAKLLAKLGRWIRSHGGSSKRQISVVSTNYDIIIDWELFEHYADDPKLAAGIDLGFPWWDPQHNPGRLYPRPAAADFGLYKLHGSLNWVRCSFCEHITMNTDYQIMYQAYREQGDIDKDNTCWCEHAPFDGLIVAPSLVRDVREPNLMAVWSAALEALRIADHWIIAGYSLPTEDIAIRSMLIRASQRGKSNPLEVTVIQHGCDDATRNRYKLLFPKCDYRTDGMEAFINSLA